MKKTKIFIFIFTIMSCLVLVSCGKETKEKYNNIEVNGRVYVSDTQTVSVEGITSAMGDAAAIFKSSISVSDISLSEALEGKIVQSVKYVSNNEIELVLSGDVKNTFTDAYQSGMLYISSNALEGKADSYCYVNVLNPTISITSTMNGGSTTNKSFYTTYSIPYGEFSEYATIDNITLVDLNNGEVVKIEVQNKTKLYVEVKNYNPTLDGASTYPKLHFNANTTSFNKEFSIEVGKAYASVLLV